MSREDPHFRLRIPAALKAEITRAAEDNARSITAEIVARLSQSGGLSFRDQFAIGALPYVFVEANRSSRTCGELHKNMAREAYSFADAMLAERERGQ